MIRRTTRPALALVLALLCTAQALTIKMGSIAPAGTPWDDALRQLAAEWATASDDAVELRIYPGGIAGDEEDMIRKMKIGQINAIGISGMGMCRVYPGILAVQLPLLVRTDEELDYVMEKMKPSFEQALEEKGMKVIIWNNAGWGRFFAKKPVVRPEDLQAQKLFNIAGDADGTQAWKDAGFNPVPLSLNDLLTSLQSGMVEAFTMTPLAAAANQSFALAPYMTGMKWAPLIGGIMVSMNTWKRVKPELRPALLEAAERVEKVMQAGIDGADDRAIAVMKEHGLKVTTVTAEDEQKWVKQTREAFARIAGRSFDVQSYEQVKRHLEEFRSNNAR